MLKAMLKRSNSNALADMPKKTRLPAGFLLVAQALLELQRAYRTLGGLLDDKR